MAENSIARYHPIVISLLLITYFIGLLLVNYFKLDAVLIGVFVELLTIPALLGVIFYGGFNVWKGFSADKAQRPIHWLAAGLLVACMAMLVWASF